MGVLYDPGSAAGLVATDPQGVHAEPPAFTTSTFFGVLSRNVGRFIVSVEGPSWHTSEVIELPRLPEIGDPIETQYGTLLVAEALATPGGQYAGKIVCRMPG